MERAAFDQFLAALTLSAGYNAALVAIGAALLGAAAGGVGSYLFLRKRALVSDAVAHATLPGLCAAFLVMAALGGDGRNLLGLLVGAALAAGIGLLLIEAMIRRTRLGEDAAIGAVLSVFFGLGVVLLTVVQNAGIGRPAGLEQFLFGSTAGMLFQDAVTIAVGGAAAAVATVALRRPLTLVAFDPDYAAARGVNVPGADLALLGLALGVTVIGLTVAGLVLIVALLIIPAVTARFWTERAERVALGAAAVGALSAYLGAAISAAAPALPTGPIIVLTATGLFLISFFCAPERGVLAAARTRLRLHARVHRRQGLLAMARGEPIYDGATLRVLRREGLIRPDGVATEAGRARAAKALFDEKRWEIAREIHQEAGIARRMDGLEEIETVLTQDEIAEIDRRIGAPQAVEERT